MKMVNIVLLTAGFCILTFTAAHGEEIINGKKAEKNSLQFIASVQKNKKHKCGGFLIHPSFVLTAAHCNITRSELSVVLGTHNIDPGNKNLRRYEVEGVHRHGSYRNGPGKGYDIMILKLSEKVNLNEDVILAKIPTVYQFIKPNTECQVARWGKTENQAKVDELLVTNVSTTDITVCKQQWKNKVDLPRNVLCAGGYKTKNGACRSDSGGPLVCSGEAVGIVSFNNNNNCKYPNPYPNVYTEIAPYATWINHVIHKYA